MEKSIYDDWKVDKRLHTLYMLLCIEIEIQKEDDAEKQSKHCDKKHQGGPIKWDKHLF